MVITGYKYPYLYRPSDYLVAKYGYRIPLSIVYENIGEDVIRRCFSRIEGALKENKIPEERISDEKEVFAFHLSLLLLSKINDMWARRRYAIAEAKRTYENLLQEDPMCILDFAKRLSVNVNIEGEFFTITIPDYLKSKRLVKSEEWKLVNQDVRKGRIFLSKQKLCRFLADLVEALLVEEMRKAENAVLPQRLLDLVEQLKNLVRKYKPKIRISGVSLEEGKYYPELFPPCIRRIYEDVLAHKDITHAERFALATFLIHIGVDEEEIVRIFSNLPDFNEKITRYQIKHLKGEVGGGKKYLPYSCEKMRSLGLCVGECGVRNPLVYYRRELFRLARQGKIKASETQSSQNQ